MEEQKMGKFQLITKGLVKENPTFVLLLGMCPTLATTTSAINGMSMGLATAKGSAWQVVYCNLDKS